MKKFFYTIILAALALTMLDSCLGNNVYDEYKDWRQKNDEWYGQQKASGLYSTIIASWDPSAQVLIRWHNDTMLTRNNLKPFITSTVDLTQYVGQTVTIAFKYTSKPSASATWEVKNFVVE